MEMLTLPSHNSYNKDILEFMYSAIMEGGIKAAPPPFYLPIPERQTGTASSILPGVHSGFLPIKIPMSSRHRNFPVSPLESRS